MLTRRLFLASAGAGCCCALHSNGSVGQEDAPFICSALDGDDDAAPRDIMLEYGAQTGIEPAVLESELQGKGILPYGMAFLRRVWKPGQGLPSNDGGIHLGVYFWNGTGAQQALVEDVAKLWMGQGLGQKVSFEFGVDKRQAQISVEFGEDGNTSLIGNDSADSARKQASLLLEDVTPQSILHEFGHALGLKHEHQHPQSGIEWEEDVVIAHFAGLGINESTVRKQIFARLDKSYICAASPGFDTDSVMGYTILREWNKAHVQIVQGSVISKGDRLCVNALYGA